ncbi:hypothetical protein GUJ93_ZPchr0013g36392 [Zizania palustris]|uniref:Uncharacterized protein n=1 Tax=Zizania palustris TaxID=103762 RepID=A0A8J5WS46_ZIZPA|nr:hypothetical protein GUJ93_ZPchr0013g36392 [Zizania palustris]
MTMEKGLRAIVEAVSTSEVLSLGVMTGAAAEAAATVTAEASTASVKTSANMGVCGEAEEQQMMLRKEKLIYHVEEMEAITRQPKARVGILLIGQ